MSECRRIIFVLSSNFLASEFCMYELHKARSKLMAEGLDVLILVILRGLATGKCPRNPDKHITEHRLFDVDWR